MAFPQYDLDREIPKSLDIERKLFIPARNGPDSMDGSCNSYPDFEREDFSKWVAKMIESGKVINRRFTRNAGGPYLWTTFLVEKDSHGLSLNFENELDFFKWCSETAHSFDLNVSQDVELWLEGSPAALICHHKEGSFNLTPKTVARCLHVANVNSLSCFLFCLRIGTFEDGTGSVINKSRLIDHLSTLLDKWNWCGENCKVTFNGWIDYVTNEDNSSEKEESLKLLYQWTLSPLQSVLRSIKREIEGAPRHDYAKVKRLRKWGDEVCDYLAKYWNLLKPACDVEFSYDAMYEHYTLTADLHRNLGEHKRATILLETLKLMLLEVEEDELLVTKLGTGKIEYLKPIEFHGRLSNVRFLLMELGIYKEGGIKVLNWDVWISRLSESRSLQIVEELHQGSDDVETHRQD